MGIFDAFKRVESEAAPRTGAPEWIVAGLGNVGPRYARTRHNTGFLMLDAFAEKQGVSFSRHKFRSMVAQTSCAGKECLLLKPETLMNASGQAVCEAMRFYKIPPEQVLVIYDDIYLAVGGIRIRKRGTDGGHNGIKNIIYLSGADTFPRIRVGVGQKPSPDASLVDWVLSDFTKDEMDMIQKTAKDVAAAIPLIVGGKIDEAMNRFNRARG